MLKRVIFPAVLLFLTQELKSQDVHFSQYDFSPLSLNPANTGNFDGDWRISSNYRTQWKKVSKAYVTNSFGYDQQVYLMNEKFSAGGFLLSDRAGDGSLKTTKIYISGAYHKTIDNHQFHFGLQPGLVLRSVDMAKITFPDQFNMQTGQFDNQLTSNEVGFKDSQSFLDVNLGLGWNRKFGKYTPAFGFALYHLNRPKDNFFNNDQKLSARKVLNANVKIDITPKIFVTPGLLLMASAKSSQTIVGSKIGYNLNIGDIKSVFVNLSRRDGFKTMNDANIIAAGVNYRNFDIGVSYDVNISDLRIATNSRGAFEIAIIYTAPNTRLKKVRIPCERI